MAKVFVENTGKSPQPYFGVMLQPGEARWVESWGDPGPKAAGSPVTTDAAGVISANGQQLGGGANYSDGQVVCDWQPSSGTLSLVSTNGGAEAVALDPSVRGDDGLPMVRCTQGNSGTFVAKFVYNAPISLAQLQSKQIPVRFDDNTAGAWTGSNSLGLFFDVEDQASPTKSWRLAAGLRALDAGELRSGFTHMISIAPGNASQGWSFGGSAPPTSTTDLDAVTIARTQIVIPNAVSGARAWLGTMRMNARRKPVITIVLDGQYISQHQWILPILEAQGLRCSLAIQGNQIGQSQRMSFAHLDRAYYVGGHEIIDWGNDPKTGGGYSNASDWADQSAIYVDKTGSQALIASRWPRGLGYAVHGGTTNDYASTVPLARQNAITAALQAAGIKAVRRGAWVQGVQDRLQSVARLGAVDPYTINGALQWTSTDNAASLIAVATRAKAKGEWGIITGHRSVVSGPGSLEVLNSDLLAWAQSLGDDVRSGRVLCLPFGEACRYYGLTT